MNMNPTNQIVIVKIQTSWRFVSSSTQEARLAGWWHRPQCHQTEVRWRQGAETFWRGSVGEVEAVEDCDRGQEDYPGPYEIWSRQTCRRCLTIGKLQFSEKASMAIILISSNIANMSGPRADERWLRHQWAQVLGRPREDVPAWQRQCWGLDAQQVLSPRIRHHWLPDPGAGLERMDGQHCSKQSQIHLRSLYGLSLWRQVDIVYITFQCVRNSY